MPRYTEWSDPFLHCKLQPNVPTVLPLCHLSCPSLNCAWDLLRAPGWAGGGEQACLHQARGARILDHIIGTREGPEPRSPRHQSWEQLSFLCLASKETAGVKVGTYMARTLMALPKTMSRAHADFLGSDPCASLALQGGKSKPAPPARPLPPKPPQTSPPHKEPFRLRIRL